ncbi:NUDIX hydrolase [Halomarina rubra]|uniref:NUDIX hydrolase n=1 Tax=Halomarina rubra TaxID=2071873 RepID=A0ABD6ARX1_9EURY|nr:NUDIX domain-containing protein [Halomarina rubra]
MDPAPLFDELRTLAQNGRRYAEDPWEEERWERVLTLTSEYYGEAFDLPADEVRDRFADEVGHVTTKVGAIAVVTDDDGRLLLQHRADDGTWGIPGGWVDPGESPTEAVVREAREETGLVVEAVESLGVFTRRPGAHGPHGQLQLPYRCRVVGGDVDPSHESLAVAYRDPETVEDWHADHEQFRSVLEG